VSILSSKAFCSKDRALATINSTSLSRLFYERPTFVKIGGQIFFFVCVTQLVRTRYEENCLIFVVRIRNKIFVLIDVRSAQEEH
jgi:hypothetical protein